MNPQQRTPSTPPSVQTQITIDELYEPLNQSLQRWGRHHHACYPVFQSLVEMDFAIVGVQAEKLLRSEANKVEYQRSVIDVDRQKAVWSLLRKAIISLEPSLLKFDRPIVHALQQVAKTGEWPRNVPVPPECCGYLALSFAYVWKSKSTREVARLFGVGRRSLACLRSRALSEVVQRFLAWERHCSTMH